MSIPREFIELLLAKIDIVELINAQVPLRKKSGSNYFACCPFHNEKSASFSVSQPKQFYHCFGCGAHGNAIDFMMEHDRLSFPEAIEFLARQVGMEVPQTARSNKKDSSTINDLYALMLQAAGFYYDQMCRSPRAINYLKKRGITGQIAQIFQIGYAPSHQPTLQDYFCGVKHTQPPKSASIDPQRKQLLDVGLIIGNQDGRYYDRFRDRIIFPIHDYRGRVIGFGGRILDHGEPKYLNSPETVLFQKGHELYGLYQAIKANRKMKRVLVVEGYLDVISLYQYGISYAVATLGTATTSHHLQRLLRYTSDIIFCFDGDDPGRNAAWRALQVIFPIMLDTLNVKFLFLPDGEDPDSLIRKEGRNAFEKRLEDALPLSNFFFQHIAEQSNLETIEGRAKFANLAFTHIKELQNGIFQSILIDELAKRARLNNHELKVQLKQTETSFPIISDATKSKISGPLRLALALVVQHPYLVKHIQETLPESDVLGYKFFRILIEFIQKRPNISTGVLLELWRGQKEEKLIAKLAQFEHMIPDEGIEQEFLGTLKHLWGISYDQNINALLAKAAQTGLSDDEKVQLNRFINKKKALLSGYA